METFPQIGMSPEVWGPFFWNTMHVVSLGYPESPSDDEKKAVIQFYNSLQYMIPCPICREHYHVLLKNSPVENVVNSRKELVWWLFNIHNEVNKQLNKRVITWEEFIKHIEHLRDSDTSSSDIVSPISFVVIGSICGVVGYYLYNKYINK